MPVEFIGWIDTQEQSEIVRRPGPVVDKGFLRRVARAHEDAGFDRALIGYGSSRPDGLQVAAYAAAHTERLGLLVAHRPGFVFPTVAARAFATLDQLSDGRAALHTITGASDAEQRRDGDRLTKDERYARTDEYLEILRLAWTAQEPVTYSGTYYGFEDNVSDVRPVNPDGLPIYFGGSSEPAYRVGGRHADVFALWGEPLAQTADQIAAIRDAATAAGRPAPRISVSFRPILGATDDLAWDRAHQILRRVQDGQPHWDALVKKRFQGASAANVGSQRLLQAAEAGERHDRALWTPIAKATGAPGNSTALVGSPETVAQALLDYVDIGVSTLLIRGFNPLDDAVDYGRFLIPLVREEIARRDAQRPAAVSA
ncbi:MAG: LLM class flavin-dependent oxidoreductase [Actinomycetota bacterium]|nr:MAG: LLM class flavin-dependent oxidoreductase [Actinomycetota bacterium]